MSWWSENVSGPVRGFLNTPMDRRAEAAQEYQGIDRSNYDLPGYDQFQQNLQGFQSYQQMGAPQAVQGQRDLTGMLMGLARGQDSLSAEQLRQNLGRLQSQQQSMAASARPSQNAMANLLAMQNAGNIGAQMSGQTALAGIAERNAAANALSGHLAATRGQDISSYLGGQQLGLQAAGMQQQGGMGYEANRFGRFQQAMGTPTKGQGLISGLTSALPVATQAFSDVRLKQNIQPLKPEMDSFLIGRYGEGGGSPTQQNPGASVAPLAEHSVRRFVETPTTEDAIGQALARIPSYQFEYKPGVGMPPGQRVGQMAQDVERVAPGAVQNTPQGKMVDYGALTPAILALVQRQQAEIESLKARGTSTARRTE